MYKTNLKTKVVAMEVGDILIPNKGYKEITLRNYACQIGKELGRKYSVKLESTNRYSIIRVA